MAPALERVASASRITARSGLDITVQAPAGAERPAATTERGRSFRDVRTVTLTD